ncbi:MAG: RagB/SusD family nutrient uptake outer membrane protein [Bacteroidales bacterium]
MKTKKYLYIAMLMPVLLLISCSESFLDVKPQGTVEESMLQTPKNADALVTAAYAMLNDMGSGLQADTWYSAIRSGDNYKGGAGTADFGGYYAIEMVSPLQSNDGTVAGAWSSGYTGISRCNKALAVLNTLTDEEMPLRKVRIAELRFLRGHWMFLLKRLFKYPVYVDETMTNEDILNRSNKEFTNEELWNLIADDFQYGVSNLPPTQPEIGRANKYAAAAYLAKTRLYQAYEQDENYNVININTSRLQEVVDMCDVVITSGIYDLFDNFGKNFTYGYDNTVESIFAIQFSKDDGTVSGKIDLLHMGDYSMAPGYGCCHANVPTQNLVNAFKTDANGLPMFNTYNDSDMSDPEDFQTNTVDPRLDHSVGIPTHPFKYDLTFVYDYSWARTPSVYGYFASMKQTQLPTSPSFKNIGFIGSSKNWDILKYDDVLLMKAEALIELGQQNAALPIINEIRTRAANTDWLKYTDGTTFSNYRILTYQDGVNINWTKDNARIALQWERRLEFAGESSRFHDLVRWGIASETVNNYFLEEKTKRTYLNGAAFTDGKNEYFPIPYSQIILSKGLYEQNSGSW